jgi:peptide/nickel transport system permease protein
MGPFIIRRIAQMLPVMFIISIIGFTVINLPPGDFLTVRIMELRARGDLDAESRLEGLTKRYGLDRPLWQQYFVWIGNFVRGDFGRSFEYEMEVKDLIGDRLTLTVILASLTLFFTWIVAIPIGIYAATHQYSLGDNIFTFIGFIGLATPNFLLALILMYVGMVHFGVSPGGLFSPEFANAPWSLARIADMMKKIWVPIVVLGTSGVAGLLRIMRGNLLDTLGQAYVRTARAKGLHERVVIFRHATRMAINPLITIAGWQLPIIISGEAIVAVILNLPTVGPLFLRALQIQDMYLAGTILIFSTVLLQIGNLLADITLALVDPRIRIS